MADVVCALAKVAARSGRVVSRFERVAPTFGRVRLGFAGFVGVSGRVVSHFERVVPTFAKVAEPSGKVALVLGGVAPSSGSVAFALEKVVIEFVRGDLFEADVEALVNAVNTVGVMGAGLALQFKTTFPANFKAYKAECKAKRLEVGRVFVFEQPGAPRCLINFPTKRHWKDASKPEYVRDGLVDLVAQVKARGIRSIAVPALGCGLGGLEWSEVRPMIEAAFAPLPGVRVLVYEPG